MEWFERRNGELNAEGVPLSHVAKQIGTPAYVYSKQGIESGYQAWNRAMANWPHTICYAVKANSNIAVLNILAKLGAGFDIVSVGELERVVAAGGDPGRVVFSGVGKQRHEIRRALELGIHCFNIESTNELEQIQQEAQHLNRTANISVRVNPDVDAETHPYISTGLKENKFGIDIHTSIDVYKRAATLPNIKVAGIGCHIGSQLMSKAPLLDALERLLVMVDQLADLGIKLDHIDIGGGLGISYHASEQPPTKSDYLGDVIDRLSSEQRYQHLHLMVEPGRSIAGPAGLLLTQVELVKQTEQKTFTVVDAAMNDLLRPSIYNAWHNIFPVRENSRVEEDCLTDIVGPVCETGDFLGKERQLSSKEGELLAIMDAGAYGFSMSSNYNSRNRPAEVVVSGEAIYVVRRRETLADQLKLESTLPTE